MHTNHVLASLLDHLLARASELSQLEWRGAPFVSAIAVTIATKIPQ
jgi:hypothetical protein